MYVWTCRLFWSNFVYFVCLFSVCLFVYQKWLRKMNITYAEDVIIWFSFFVKKISSYV